MASISSFGNTVSYDYDFFGRLKSATDSSVQWNYQYNSIGKKEVVENLSEGTTEYFTYDSLGRTEKKTILDTDNEIIFEIAYVLGADGNRIGAVEKRGERRL